MPRKFTRAEQLVLLQQTVNRLLEERARYKTLQKNLLNEEALKEQAVQENLELREENARLREDLLEVYGCMLEQVPVQENSLMMWTKRRVKSLEKRLALMGEANLELQRRLRLSIAKSKRVSQLKELQEEQQDVI